MFSYNKTAALCLAVVAFSSGVNAKEEAAQTFGLLGAGLHGGAGVGAGVGAVFFSNYSCLMPRLSRVHPDATSTGRQHCVRML
ncbi:hypothetical protein PC111_g23648 [Phytophthora cactorum]|nr:hypothetical protein PC111_g23648 [Phytophthora cactorum]